jgi:mono/diheme cytochrome c family protein
VIRYHSLAFAFPATVALVLSGCSPAPDGPAEVQDIEATVRAASIPARLVAGETAFNANCAACHGDRALGTTQGPPLVHIYYEPNHHADIAFHLAVERGVRAHHWSFGDMPPVPGVERSEVEAIIAYVRFLQREGGIF